jgi:hypothetical protein
VTLSGDPTQGEVFVTSHFLGKPGSTPRERVKVRIFLGDDNSGVGAFLNAKLGTRPMTKSLLIDVEFQYERTPDYQENA